MRLVDLDPSDVGLLQQISRVLISRGQVDRATDLLERALKADGLDRKSTTFVNLHRDLGTLYAAQGRMPEAATSFEVLLGAIKDPTAYGIGRRERIGLIADPETTYERLGEVFLEAERTDLAVQAFEEAAAARRGKPGVFEYNLARVYLKAAQPAKALERIDAYVAKGRTDRGRAAYDLLVEILTAAGREDDVAGRLEEIAAERPDDPFVRLTLADRLAAAGDLDAAAKLYEQALESAKDGQGYAGLARVYAKRKDAGKVVETLARAAVAGASDETLAEVIAEVAADEALTAAVLKSAASDAEPVPPRIDFSSAYLLAKLASKADRLDDASTFYRVAARLRPDRASELHEEFGQKLLAADRYDEAAKLFREALDGPADDATRLSYLFFLSNALELSGKTDEALAAVRDGLRIAPDSPLFRYQEGWVHFHARHWEQAEALLRKTAADFRRPTGSACNRCGRSRRCSSSKARRRRARKCWSRRSPSSRTTSASTTTWAIYMPTPARSSARPRR